MKKRICFLALCLSMIIVLSGCVCIHEWKEADCENPQTCTKCGATKGEALGHMWAEPNCIASKRCIRCGLTEGEPLGHDWAEATCEAPKTCRICGRSEGDPLPHEWVEADCENPKTCKNCGKTEGQALGHEVAYWNVTKQSTCTVKGQESGLCSRCGETVTRTVALKEHTPGNWEVTEEATETKSGKRVKKCTVCGKVLDSETFTLTPEEIKQNYIKECEDYSYNTIARNPDNYIGLRGKVKGKVVQVIEDGNEYTLRVAMNNSYSNMILAVYTKPQGADRILEDDRVAMYGNWMGTYTYESTMGASITVPLFMAEYLDIG